LPSEDTASWFRENSGVVRRLQVLGGMTAAAEEAAAEEAAAQGAAGAR